MDGRAAVAGRYFFRGWSQIPRDMLKKVLEGGWIRCPEFGSEDVGWDQNTGKWSLRFHCKDCDHAVGGMVGR